MTVDIIGVDAGVSTLDWETLQRMVASGRACGLEAGPVMRGRDWLVIRGAATDDGAAASAASRLLDAMLAAVGLDRERTALVTRLVRCPRHASGTATCRSCLDRQIELLGPRIVLVVGDAAAAALFPEAPDFMRFRGSEHTLTIAGRAIPVVATFDPSRLLEDGAAKAHAWADLCLARTIHERLSAAAIA